MLKRQAAHYQSATTQLNFTKSYTNYKINRRTRPWGPTTPPNRPKTMLTPYFTDTMVSFAQFYTQSERRHRVSASPIPQFFGRRFLPAFAHFTNCSHLRS